MAPCMSPAAQTSIGVRLRGRLYDRRQRAASRPRGSGHASDDLADGLARDGDGLVDLVERRLVRDPGVAELPHVFGEWRSSVDDWPKRQVDRHGEFADLLDAVCLPEGTRVEREESLDRLLS